MRLAVVCYPTYGGSGVVATELATALASRGHQVHMVSYEAPFRFETNTENLWFHKVDVSDYPLFQDRPYSLNLANELIALVREHGVQVIHSHYAIPHAQAAWMAREVLLRQRQLDVKLACTLHGTDITLVGREHSFFELTRFAIQRQDLLTAPSDWLRRETEEFFHVESDQIGVIPNFIDLERFQPAERPDVRRELDAEGRYLVTHVSNFRPVKRAVDVVQAFAVLCEHHAAVLALVGEGPDLEAALKMATVLGVRDNVRALGKLEQLECVLQASDLFFLPSVAESFGLAALEAQACGCPVIGYRAGGLPEVVIDGETGLLCPEGEDVCLGTLAAHLLGDADRTAAMRAAARRNAERFDRELVVDRYEQALCRLVHDHPKPALEQSAEDTVPCLVDDTP